MLALLEAQHSLAQTGKPARQSALLDVALSLLLDQISHKNRADFMPQLGSVLPYSHELAMKCPGLGRIPHQALELDQGCQPLHNCRVERKIVCTEV